MNCFPVTIRQGAAAETAANYQAAVNKRNAQIAEVNAQEAEAFGREEERRERLRGEQFKGSQRVASAVSGAVVDQDSDLDLLLDATENIELDALAIRSDAERRARNFRNQSVDLEADASASRARGRDAKTSSILTGATGVADRFGRARREGVF